MEKSIKIKVDNKELAGYLEAQFEDIFTTLENIVVKFGEDKKFIIPRGVKIKVNEKSLSEFGAKLDKITSTLNQLNKKELVSKINVDLSDLKNEFSELKKVIVNTKPPEIKMPEIKIPEIKMPPQEKLDITPIKEVINQLKSTLLKTKLSAEISNLDQIPMVLSQTPAKGQDNLDTEIKRISGIDGVPLGYQQLIVSNTAVELTVPSTANKAVIVVGSQNVRYRDDGVSPTSSAGIILYQNQSMQIVGATILAAIKFIRVSTDATLDISYYNA